MSDMLKDRYTGSAGLFVHDPQRSDIPIRQPNWKKADCASRRRPANRLQVASNSVHCWPPLRELLLWDIHMFVHNLVTRKIDHSSQLLASFHRNQNRLIRNVMNVHLELPHLSSQVHTPRSTEEMQSRVPLLPNLKVGRWLGSTTTRSLPWFCRFSCIKLSMASTEPKVEVARQSMIPLPCMMLCVRLEVLPSSAGVVISKSVALKATSASSSTRFAFLRLHWTAGGLVTSSTG